MSDSLLQTFYRYGTAAQRALFTPDPPVVSAVAVQIIYVWYETDTGDTYLYDTSWHILSVPQGLDTTDTPEFAKIGVGTPADANAVAIFDGQYYSPLIDDGNSGVALTVNWNLGNEHHVTMTGNCTFTFSNPVNGGRYVLLLATGAGGFTATWPASVLWSGGSTPTVTATASKVDLFTFIYVASTAKYYGAYNQAY